MVMVMVIKDVLNTIILKLIRSSLCSICEVVVG